MPPDKQEGAPGQEAPSSRQNDPAATIPAGGVSAPGPRFIDLGAGEGWCIGTAADMAAAADYLARHYPDGPSGDRSAPVLGPVLNMGAANSLAAYKLYAGKIPPTSLAVLVYMALVSLDRDSEPHWWEGHAMLAVRCFGYPEPVADAGLRAVRRAVTPLLEAGAITTTRHGSGRKGRVTTARYRLWLTAPAQDGKRPVDKPSTGRKTVEHRTVSGRTQDGNRPTKEYEEKEERDNTGVLALDGTEEGAPAAPTAADQDPDFSVSGHDPEPHRQAASGRPDTRTPAGTAQAADASANALREWQLAEETAEWARNHPGEPMRQRNCMDCWTPVRQPGRCDDCREKHLASAAAS
jgi:hypothetical protein